MGKPKLVSSDLKNVHVKAPSTNKVKKKKKKDVFAGLNPSVMTSLRVSASNINTDSVNSGEKSNVIQTKGTFKAKHEVKSKSPGIREQMYGSKAILIMQQMIETADLEESALKKKILLSYSNESPPEPPSISSSSVSRRPIPKVSALVNMFKS